MTTFEPRVREERRTYHIGGLARLCGFSVHAIRWYEAQGLIPNVGRDRGGRRVYEDGHVEHLAFIDRMRRSGMPVADLRRLTALGLEGWRTLPARRALLAAHRARVVEEMARLREALRLVEGKIAYYAEWEAKKKRPPPELLPAPRGRSRRTRPSPS